MSAEVYRACRGAFVLGFGLKWFRKASKAPIKGSKVLSRFRATLKIKGSSFPGSLKNSFKGFKDLLADGFGLRWFERV